MLSSNIPPWKLLRWFRRPLLWATDDWQLHHDKATTHASRLRQSFLWNIKSPSWLNPRFDTMWLLAFSETNITFERREVSDHQWDSGEYDGAADGDWENCVRSQGVYFEGDLGVSVLCTVFLVSCIFSTSLSLSYDIAGYLLDRSHIFLSTI